MKEYLLEMYNEWLAESELNLHQKATWDLYQDSIW